MDIETQLADFATAPVTDHETQGIMRLAVFDWAVCALAGRAEAVAGILRKKGVSEGGAPQATVVGGGKLPCPRAALINGAISHALDYDDTHFAHIGHTSVAVVPAALAVAEHLGADMPAFLDAALIGSEAAVRIGVWLGRDHYQVGFHQTATAGAFGAALSALRLMGATQDQMIKGLGLAATRASGLKSQFGTMGKPLNAGLAAEAGVEAALWAMAGITSADRGLGGPLGFGETHHGAADMAGLDGIGTHWQMKTVSHKFHACCHGLHAMLEALGTLDIDPDEVQMLQVTTHPRWMGVCNKPAPRTGLEAKFSYRQTAAMQLMGVDTGAIASFSDDMVTDPRLIALRDRVNVVANDKLTEMQARVVVILTDGQRLKATHDLDAPLPFDARHSKIMNKGRVLLGEAQADAMWHTLNADDLTPFLHILGGADQP